MIIDPGAIATEFGDVMVKPMLERSGNGPYKAMAQSMAKTDTESYDTPGGSSPSSVISDVIAKAIDSQQPRTRYAVGKLAKPILFMRRFLSDRAFDRTIMSRVS